MLTRIEISGFKTFDSFSLDFAPFSAIVGPNASGKSNLFDAIRFLSLLSQYDIRTAMQQLRGEPEELFRQTPRNNSQTILLAAEVLLNKEGRDAFGSSYSVSSRRLRYEVGITLGKNNRGVFDTIYVSHELCHHIKKKNDTYPFSSIKKIRSGYRKTPFIEVETSKNEHKSAFLIRQDGTETDARASKRGRPVTIPAEEASRTALSTITTAEFPHLYALKDLLASISFLEINPSSARKSNDRFDDKKLRSDASNLAAALSSLRTRTANDHMPEGVLADISSDLSSLIPTVKSVNVISEEKSKEYSYNISTSDSMNFSSRVISDGTLRLLALLTILDDPDRSGILCFEEPENGVHEGRIDALVELLRESASDPNHLDEGPVFQVVVNTHSPAVMHSLKDHEIIAADMVRYIQESSNEPSVRTRMRSGVKSGVLDLNAEHFLTRPEILSLLKKNQGQA